ncbi:hypothetical protein QS774_12235, partial [Escherichia coli]|nr:hypothetical protein [Escherichia coli]
RDDFGLKIGKLSHRTSIKDGLGRHIGSCGPLNRNFLNNPGRVQSEYPSPDMDIDSRDGFRF